MRKLQFALKILLGLNLFLAGLGHLTWARTEFLAQVPHWVPLDADLVVVLSGIVEIILGLLLTFWKKREDLLGVAVAVFFILIFPGNISQYVNQVSAFGLDTDRARFVRLFFQPVLIFWALWSCGSLPLLRKKNNH